MKYDLLIIDDEELIRKGVIARIEYLELEVGNVYEAASGEEGLLLVKSHHIDIVLTDIRMPRMNGLTFVKEARALKEELAFIIFSGHAEFEYARKAITLGVSSYLLKPISNEELCIEFHKVTAALREKQRLQQVETGQRRLKKEQKEYQLEKEMNELLAQPFPRTAISKELYANLNSFLAELFLGNRKMQLATIYVEPASYENSSFQQEDYKLLQFSVKNVFNEIETKCEKICVNNLTNRNQLYGLFYTDGKGSLRMEIEQLFLKMQSVFQEQMDVILTFGVCNCTQELSMVQAKEAKAALDQRLVYGISNIYFYEDIDVFQTGKFPSTQLSHLEQYLRQQNAGKIGSLLQDIFADEMVKKYGFSYIRMMWVRILNMVLIYFDPDNNPYSSLEKILMSFDRLNEFQTLKEMEESLWKIILDCIKYENLREVDAGSKIRLAVHYIQEHYGEYISINDLAQRFDMSPNYFSTVFKREMNQSTVNYINGFRIERAKEYLKNSDQSVVDIARKVGYDDSQYFFRVFKKLVGMTPLSFRQDSRSSAVCSRQ